MTEFNFGGISEMSAVNSSKSLQPWGIYPVIFDGLELNDIKGKKDPEAIYKAIKISFRGEDGNFSTNIFIPNSPEEAKRPTYTNKDGHEYEGPSRFENFKWTLLQMSQVLNPEGHAKLQTISNKIKTMDEFLKAVIQVINAKKGTKTNIKLTGRTTQDGKVYAQIPNVVGVNKDGEAYISNTFIGDKLFWSDYEKTRVDAYNFAKPTNMDTIPTLDNLDSHKGSEDLSDLDTIDFDKLL